MSMLERAKDLITNTSSGFELTEIREHKITTTDKNVVTLVFRFERYE